ncbi:MAG: ABC transporter substrate-binding protein [Alphaproteobacteria bacterium]
MTDKNGIGTPIDRRSLLMLMAATAGGAALGGFGGEAEAADPVIEVTNPKYNSFYNGVSGYYMKDPGWVSETTARLTWPKEGEVVPEIGVLVQSNEPSRIDAFRKWSSDAVQIGLKYNVQQVSEARWLDLIQQHRHGDIEVHPAILRPERVDPAEWLVSRAYGPDRRNYGEWVNEQYDALIDEQTKESDPKKRLEIVRKAQTVLAEDLYITQFGWGPSIIEGYNAGAWDDIVQTRGFGIASFNAFHGYLKMKPKTSRKSVRVGMTALLETTNLMAAGNNMRSIGRMIYDRLAYFDENLNIIPWAAESWNRLDDRTWDIKLRPGMKFHDGKPVTVKDLKFTFDFMQKWERGIFWTANRFLDKTEIVDEANGVLRAKFKQPYGQFESYFMQLNVILPQHIWQNIMQEQGVGDNPRQLRIERPIGSGPFRFGRHRKDTELQLIAQKDHFSKPQLDEIWAVVTPTLDGLLGRLESEELDFIESSDTTLRPSQAKQAARNKHIKIVTTPDVNWLHGVCRISCLPWRDFEFRRAWHHSIDRDFLVNVAWEGAGRVPKANTFLVDGNPWNNPDLPPLPGFDLKKSREILKAAGYSWRADGRLVYPPPSDTAFRERVTRVTKPGYTWGGLKMLG